MRRVVYSAAMSLDGRIAGPEGEYDWIPDEPGIDWGEFMARFDTVLMGRRSWEVVRAMPREHRPPQETLVFSDTLAESGMEGARLVRRDRAPAVIRQLKEAQGRDIWLFGGGELFRSLLDQGLVDVVEAAVVPALLGRGIPLLAGGPGPVALRLESSRAFPSGLLLVRYAVQ